MKRHYPIGLFLLLALLAACAKVPEPERSLSPRLLSKVEASKGRRAEGPTLALQAIDSLMWQQPDSALLALMVYEGDASEYNHHYAQLLTSELLYKNDYEQTNRPELQQAVAYFDSLMQVSEPQRSLSLSKGRSASAKTTAFLDARAHYINGVGYYERDSVIEACREYLKALEVMEGHFEEKEMVGKKAKFMALTYTHVEGLFSDFYLHDQAIYFGKKSLNYYKKYTASPRHVAWMLNEFGSQYEMKEMFDSACFYYQSGINALPDTNNLTYRDLATHLAFCSYKKDETLSSSLTQLYNLLRQAESERERLSRYLTLGEFYYHEKQLDSARLYLSIIYKGAKSIGSKKQAAEWLVEISEVEGRPSEAHEYARFLVPFATTDETQSALKSQLTTLCQNYMLEKQKQLHQKRSNKLVIAIPVAVIVAFVVVFAIKRRSKKQMERERHAHKMQQAALTGKLRKSNEALRELKGQLQQQENEAVSKPEQANSFADEPICQLIMERVKEGQFKSKVDYWNYKDYALDKEQLMVLRVEADRHFQQFTVRLKKAYPELTKVDLDYCCLYLLGLTDADVAALMQRAYNTVSERNKKLRKVFGNGNALPVTLQGIANGFINI